MINTEFVNVSQFKLKISNEAKLLYFYIVANADDKGFCAKADELIIILNSVSGTSKGLIDTGYDIALKELLDKGYLYSFVDSYDNIIYLVRHWYIHNQIPKDRESESNYEKFLEKVCLDDDNVYQMKSSCNTSAKQVPSKCKASAKQVYSQNKLKENKINENNIMNEMNNIACVHTKEEESSSCEGEEELSVPDQWDNESELLALNILVKEKNGSPITPAERNYLLQYKLSKKGQ